MNLTPTLWFLLVSLVSPWPQTALVPGSLKPVTLIKQDGECLDAAVAERVPILTPPVLALQVAAPAQANANGEVEYNISVLNRSEAPAHHVLLRDPLAKNARFVRASGDGKLIDGEVQWKLGTIAANGKKCVTLVLASTDGKDLENCVRIQFEHGVCVTTKASCEKATTMPRPDKPPPEVTESRLGLVMEAPQRQAFTAPIAVRLTVTNTGTANATNLRLINRVPPRSEFVSASDGGKPQGENRVAWELGTLEPGKSRSVELKVRALVPGTFLNQAEALADGDVKAIGEVSTEVTGAPGLHIAVADAKDPLMVGEETYYSITVRNQGSGPVTNVRITATAPPELGVVRVQGPVDHRKEGQKVIYDVFNLPAAPNNETVLRVHVKALKAGYVKFVVELTADHLSAGPVREEESTNIVSDPPDLEQVFRRQPRRDVPPPVRHTVELLRTDLGLRNRSGSGRNDDE